MKKNILLLINGFGVEQADSYNVYSKELMPNLDRLTKERLFTSLDSRDLDYKDGYRTFSIGISEALTYTIVENKISDGTYRDASVFKTMMDNCKKYNSKIHIFCYYENNRTIEQLLVFLREFTSSGIKIFIHMLLCQKSLNDYKEMANILTKVNYEFENSKIGIVSGVTRMDTLLHVRDLQKSLITEYGENWKDFSKKIDVLVQTRTIPQNTRTFTVSSGYKMANNDQVLFFNYTNSDVTNFVKELGNQKYVPSLDVSTIKYYSLFPTKSDPQIPFAFNFAVSSTYFLNSMKSIGAKCLVFDMKDKCSYINYYLTGLRNTIDPDLRYMAIDDGITYDKIKVIELIRQNPQDLIILNYEIDTCKDIPFMEKRLSLIDEIIGEIEKIVLENNWGLFISSLYGIEKELMNDKFETCEINFSIKVPLIVVDKSYSKVSNTLREGNVYNLANTIFENINKKFKGNSLIRKKSGLFSILYKKPKGGN